ACGFGPSRPGRGRLPLEQSIHTSWPSKIRTNESGHGRSNCSSRTGRGRMRQTRGGNETKGKGESIEALCRASQAINDEQCENDKTDREQLTHRSREGGPTAHTKGIRIVLFF